MEISDIPEGAINRISSRDKKMYYDYYTGESENSHCVRLMIKIEGIPRAMGLCYLYSRGILLHSCCF